MNVTINYEEMAEAFVCNHEYNQNIYSRYIQYSPPSQDIHKRLITKNENH